MPVHTLRASYVLRLTQRLSRLSFELRDVRTGQTHRFDNAAALSSFLDNTVAGVAGGTAPASSPGLHPLTSLRRSES